MPPQDSLTLFTTIDSSWLPYACMMVGSVRRHFGGTLRYWVVHEEIPQAAQDLVVRWANRKAIDLSFVHFDSVRPRTGVDLSTTMCPRWAHHRSVAFWGRYLAKYFLPTTEEVAIYSDVDMLAVRSIDSLARVDLGGKPVGAVHCPAPWAASAIGIPVDEYVNNGLLAFDLRRFVPESCVADMRRALGKRDLRYGPQCAFNVAMKGRVKKLDLHWNVQGELRSTVGADARIVHFTGDIKPWHTLSSDDLRDLVKRELMSTPFPNAWRSDFSIPKATRLLGRAAKRLLRRRNQ